MIEDTLDGAKSKRYRHVARHLAECQSLASLISDYGQFETHEGFLARLRAGHGRKAGLWTLAADTAGANALAALSRIPVAQLDPPHWGLAAVEFGERYQAAVSRWPGGLIAGVEHAMGLSIPQEE
jgi:hypothetical protein